MTDSLENLGTAPLMTWAFNWKTPPPIEYLHSRTIRGFTFTAQEMDSDTDNTPFRGTYKFLIYDKQTEYAFLEFFLEKRGRLKRYWIKSPEQAFTLKADVSAGSSVIYVEDNRADYIWQGVERIWIKLADGSEITRSVNLAERDVGNNRINLYLDTLTSQAFTVADVVVFGRVYLVRSDLDKYSFKYHTDTVCEISIKVYEVVEEYDDV